MYKEVVYINMIGVLKIEAIMIWCFALDHLSLSYICMYMHPANMYTVSYALYITQQLNATIVEEFGLCLQSMLNSSLHQCYLPYLPTVKWPL